MAKRTVEESSLILVADSIRAKAGKSGKLEFPSGFKSAIDGITKSEIKNQDITITENGTYAPASGFTGFGSVKVEVEGSGGDIPDASTAEFGKEKIVTTAPDGKLFYNGVLLPEIPGEIKSFSYIAIKIDDGVYQVLGCTAKLWRNPSKLGGDPTVLDQNAGSLSWATYDATTDSWGTVSSGNLYSDFDSIIWANYDIPDGSETATTIYFEECAEPTTEVVSGYGDYVDGADKYAVAIEALNEIAHRIQLHHSSYDLVSGAEIFDFLSRSVFVEKGYANSTLEIDFESSASGSLN